jgi:sugar O-acyltransferase (sialic acid O-acetyltransferase NeuD family)
MKSLIIIGSGGHAKVVLNALLNAEQNILGFVSPNREIDSDFCGYKILGNDEFIDKLNPDDVALVNGIGFIAKDSKRKYISEKFKSKGFDISTVIHPSASIANEVTIEDGVQIMAGAIIQSGTYIGSNTVINTGAIIDHDCIIGENCHIAPGVVLSGNVRVGRESFIGVGSSVIHNIAIGDNCTVAAGSVLFKDVDDCETFIQYK